MTHLESIPAAPSTRGSSIIAVLLGIAGTLLASGAWAHTGALTDGHPHAEAVQSVMMGFMHPMRGIDHLATMLAIGFWGALSARRNGSGLLWGPLAFASMLLVGAVMGVVGWRLPGVEPVVAASVLVLGILVFWRTALQQTVTMVLVGGFALFHGLAHGTELVGSAQPAWTLAGMLGATLLLHVCGMAAGWNLRYRSIWLTRVAGASLAGLGAHLLLALA